MGVEERMNKFYAKYDAAIVEPLIEQYMDTELAIPPPDSMVPKKVWREKLQSDLRMVLHGGDLFQRIESGLKAIKENIATLPPIEQKKLQDDCVNGLNRWVAASEKENDKEEVSQTQETPPSNLDETMGLSEETINYFYSVGVGLYQQQQYQKASDVFSFLTVLNIGRFDVWIALGLSEQQLSNWESALNAYGMAACAQFDSPYPYIYSAECCINMSDTQEALLYLDTAEEKLNGFEGDQHQALSERVSKLRNKCNK